MLPFNPQLKRFDMRWRFDYANRPAKYGKWSHSGYTNECKAWCQPKDGLVRACIEGKEVGTNQVMTLAECDGWDFVNFKWMAVAMAPGNFRGTIQPLHALTGMRLVTRENETLVFPNGQTKVEPRSDEDKRFHYATFGR
jgi:hypothetical protein